MRPGSISGKPLVLEDSSGYEKCSFSSRDPVFSLSSAPQDKHHIRLSVNGFPSGPVGLCLEKAFTLLLEALNKGKGEPAKVGGLPSSYLPEIRFYLPKM